MKTPFQLLGALPAIGRMLDDPGMMLIAGMALSGQPFAVILVLPYFYIYFNLKSFVGSRRAIQSADEATNSFLNNSNLKIHRVQISKILPDSLLREIEFRPSFARKGFRSKLRAEIVPFLIFWVEAVGLPVPSEWRAYPSVKTPRLIFLLDNPSKQTPHGKFRLLHELHHVSIEGAGNATSRALEKYMAPWAALIIGISANHGLIQPQWMPAIFALTAAYFLIEYTVSEWEWRVLSELMADQFAISNVGTRLEQRLVFETKVRTWERALAKPKCKFLKRLEWKLRIGAMRARLLSDDRRPLRKIMWQGAFQGDLRKWHSALVASRTRTTRFDVGGAEEYGSFFSIFGTAIWLRSKAFMVAFFAAGFAFTALHEGIFWYLVLGAAIAFHANVRLIDESFSRYRSLEELLLEKGLVKPSARQAVPRL